jgi:hypothetical protein
MRPVGFEPTISAGKLPHTQWDRRLRLVICVCFRGSAAQRGLWPPRSIGLLITHKDAPWSVGLLWTSDQFVAETSAWQHITLTTDIHYPGGIRTHDLSRRAAVDLRLRPRDHWYRRLRLVVILKHIGPIINTIQKPKQHVTTVWRCFRMKIMRVFENKHYNVSRFAATTVKYFRCGVFFKYIFIHNMLHYIVILHVLVCTLLHSDCFLFVRYGWLSVKC